MSHTAHYKVSILGALISSIAFTALAVFAIAPGETLDPVNTHNNVCSGPTDPACAINLYEDLDADSVLYLDSNGDIATDTNFVRNGEEFFVRGEVVPDALAGFRIGDLSLPALFGGGTLSGVGLEMISDEFHHVVGLVDSGFAILTEDTLAGTGGTFAMDALGVDFSFLMDNDVSANFGSNPTGVSFQWVENSDRYQLRLNNTGLQYIFGFDLGGAPQDYYVFPNALATSAGQVLTDENGDGILSWETPVSGITGSGTANQIAYWDGVNSMTSDADFTFDDTTGEFIVSSALLNPGFTESISVGNLSLGQAVPAFGSFLQHSNGTNNNFVFTGDGTEFGQSEEVTFFGWADATFANLSLIALQPEEVRISMDSTTGAGFSHTFEMTTNGINIDWSSVNDSNITLNDSGVKFSFSGAEAYTFPVVDGSADQVLTTDGLGSLSWETIASSPISVNNVSTLYSDSINAGQGDLTNGNNVFLGNSAGSGAINAYQSNFLGYAGIGATNVSFSNFFGTQAGLNATDASHSNFFGNRAGEVATSSSSANSNFFGQSAGLNATNAPNSNFFGTSAGNDAANASNSNFFGNGAGSSSSGASFSNFLGFSAGSSSASASFSNFFGYQAGASATSATNSNFFGTNAGYDADNASQANFIGEGAGSGSTFAANSNFIGANSGSNAVSASFSNFIGSSAGLGATNGRNSTFIGRSAGETDQATIGSINSNNSIFIGNYAGNKGGDINLNNSTSNPTDGCNVITCTSILIGDDTSTGGFSNSIAIGYQATNTATNQFALSDDISKWKFQGESYTLPTDFPGTSDFVLVSSTTGTMEWKDKDLITSDENLKSNIIDLDDNILSLVSDIRTVTYTLNDDLNQKTRVGFVAQDIEQYFPELVSEDLQGNKGVYYAQMTPILTKAIQELDLKLVDIQTLSDETFLSRMQNWFADAGNGIQRFFAKEIYTEQICVAKSDGTDFCINGDQLESVMNGSGNQIIYTSNNNNQNNSGDTDEPIIGESSNNEVIEENGDSSDSEPQMDVDGETGVDTATNTDASPSEDQSTENTTPSESSSESTTDSDSSSESGDTGTDSGAESGSGIDE